MIRDIPTIDRLCDARRFALLTVVWISLWVGGYEYTSSSLVVPHKSLGAPTHTMACVKGQRARQNLPLYMDCTEPPPYGRPVLR